MASRLKDAALFRQMTVPEDPRDWGAKCDVCPLRGAKPVFGDGPASPLIAYIGEAPGRDEVVAGMPFIGKSGEIFEAWLERTGWKRREVHVSNAIACFPPGGDMSSYLQKARKDVKAAGLEWNDPVDCCRPRLFRELNIPICKSCGKWAMGPDAVMCSCTVQKQHFLEKREQRLRHIECLGNYAMESVYGVSGITARRGYIEKMEDRRTRLVARSGVKVVKVKALRVGATSVKRA